MMIFGSLKCLKRDKLSYVVHIHSVCSTAINCLSRSVADPGVVPRVPGHHPRLQGSTHLQTTPWLDS